MHPPFSPTCASWIPQLQHSPLLTVYTQHSGSSNTNSNTNTAINTNVNTETKTNTGNGNDARFEKEQLSLDLVCPRCE